ncbi:MAG: ComEC/Rec2 family competence protein [Patescibacteria group bacterium]
MRPMRSVGLYIFVSAFSLTVVSESFVALPWEYGIFALVLVTSFTFVRSRSHIPAYSFMVGVAIAIAILRMSMIPAHLPEAFESLVDRKVVLEGSVVALPDMRESENRVTVEVTKDRGRTRIIAAVPLYPSVHVGDRIRVSGVLKKPQPFATDGGRTFAYDAFLRKDGVYALMQPASAESMGEDGRLTLRFLRVLEYIKDAFIELLTRALPEPESALAAGLVVGGKQGLGKILLEAFTTAGMLQIVVLSGYNVMIVAETIFRALSRFPRRAAGLVAGASIICFVLAAGAGSSALRAGLMALFAISARASGKKYQVLRILTITFFLLALWNPLLIVYDPGFQFSFLATLGLIIGSPMLEIRLVRLRSPFLREAVATTLAAQIGVLPLLLWQTGNLSLVAVPANVLAMPAIPFAMGLSTLAALVATPLGLLLSTLPLVAGFPAYVLLSYVIHVATIAAALPLAQVILPAFSFWWVVFAYALLTVIVVRAQRLGPAPVGAGPRNPIKPSAYA